ncbi:MAG: TetR/AcrR family transcriptional regulator [Paenibacillus lautus]|jgi:AcrR family transcriptional regulator|uniref:TetR/AcrR family transcriptional regulator n=1 Tax=Paenibacillus lautus TaxID=1401 RepID=UPI0026EBA495|nr:TetR/AcrR family transcriptional regulator [Paenibacillus lautus]MCI1776209.1 TetR/AcrR family transcriptional regulator [Paenibacillus lautus]
MPKKFSDEEREWIRKKLLTEARHHFETSGLRKTSVGDLTKAAGIAQGSFYMFFGSKEEIYYELILEEEQRIRNAVLDLFPPEDVCSKESIKRFLLYSLGMMDESPLLRQMMDRGEMELLFRKLPKDLLERNFTEDQDALLPVITAWQKAGILSGTASESIVGMIRSMALLTLHKKEIGEEQFSSTIELLVELLSAGMIAVSKAVKGDGMS